MKKKYLLLAAAFVLIMAAAGVGYRLLTDRYNPSATPDQSVSGTDASASENTQEDTLDVSVQEDLEEAPADEDAGDAGPLPAQDFIVLDQAGEMAYLSDYFGKPIVLNFWATWCGPCESELPAFQTAWETYGEDVNFLMINLTDGSRETEETVREFLDETGYTFPVYYDTSSSAAYTYGAYSIPLTVFIDKDGNVYTGYIGAIPYELLETHITELLAGNES